MATIQQIYIALFGRPADPGGLAFWTDLTNNGADLSQLIGRLTAEPEALDRFEGLTSQEIVNLIYQSLFGRDVDDEGEFFVDGLESGEFSLETLAIRILDGATGSDAQVIANKEAAANLFTASLDTQEKVDAYVGIEAGQIAAQIFEGITEDPATVPTPERVEEVVDDVVAGEPGGGGEPGEPEEPEPGPGPGPGPEPTFVISANADGVVTFSGTATGPIDIGAIHTAEGVTWISATRAGIKTEVSVSGFERIEATSGQAITASGHVADGLALNLTGGATLSVFTFFPPLDAGHPQLPELDLSGVSVNGQHGIEAIWDSVSTPLGVADKFKLFWNMFDKAYYEGENYYNLDLNAAKVWLAERYVEYLDAGNAAITDIVQTKVGGVPNFEARQQSLHDNILGEINDAAIADRFDVDPRSDAALAYGGRPWESGQPVREVSEADVWDLLNEVSRPDLGADPVLVIDGESEFGWQRDRFALEEIDVAGDGTITFTIDPDGPEAPASNRYQGAKLTTEEDGTDYFNLTGDSIVTATLHIDAGWADDDGLEQLTGLWIQMQNDEGDIGGGGRFSIVEYLDADAVEALGIEEDGFVAGFRFWNSIDSWDHYVNFEGDGEVNLTFAFLDGAHVWFINDEVAYTYTGAVTDEVSVLETVIFNSQNFGEDQTYTYSNVSLGNIGAPDTFV